MSKIFYEIVTNKLGNALALINLAIIAANATGSSDGVFSPTLVRLSFLVNVPSRVASAVIFSDRLLPYWSNPASLVKYSLLTLVFVYLQWVTIGWVTQRISRMIQPCVR